MKILVTRSLPGHREEELKKYYATLECWSEDHPIPRESLIGAIEDTHALLCQLTDRIDSGVLDAARSLKFISTYSAGLDHIDLNLCKRRGIRVSHTPGILTNATADLTWALILACARRVTEGNHFLREGSFAGFSPSLFLGKELSGSVLGIFGYGKIGQAVARRAEGFGMRVLSNRDASLEKLLKESDILSLHCPLTPETRHRFGAKEFSSMKRDAIFINTARGPVVDETALMEHLRSNPEFRAGADVFEREPEVTPGLVELPNFVGLPHLGSATVKTRILMAEIAVAEAIRFAKGVELQYEYGNGQS